MVPIEEVAGTMKELDISFLPFSPLGKGFLTMTVSKEQSFAQNDICSTISRFNEPENPGKNQALAERM